MKKAPSHLCDLCATSNSYSIIQISSNYAKLPQPKKRGEGGLKSTPKIGSRLTTLGTTFLSFCPLFSQLTTCGPLKIGWNRLSFCQIWSNHISPFRYSKSPENLDFPGFLNHFDIVWTVDYRLLNCGARRAALRPYFTKPKLDFAWFYAVFQAFCSSSTSS